MLLKNEDKDYWNNNDSSYYLHHLATDVNLKGVGKALINYAIEQCRINNKKYLRLDCYQESKFHNKHYEKLSFYKVGNGTDKNYNFNLWEMKI